MSVYQLFFVLVCCVPSSLMQKSQAVNVTDFKIVVPEQLKLRNASNLSDAKIQMMVQNQTDYIKKIIATEKKINSQKPPEAAPHKEISLEEYNNCRYLQLLFNETQAKNKSKTTVKKPPPPTVTTESFKAIIGLATVTPQKPTSAKQSNYFFVTQHPPPTSANVQFRPSNPPVTEIKQETSTEEQYYLTHTPNPKPHIKYVEYEQAILQKVVMDDGKTMFYRYNNPTMSYYMPGMYPQSLKIPSSTQEPSSTEHTTSTTESPITDISSRIPNYEIDYGTPQPPKQNNSLSALRFVIPVPFSRSNTVETSQPLYFINAYGYQYYRNPIQRTSAPIPMPYVPVYNVIRTLTIPESPTQKKK